MNETEEHVTQYTNQIIHEYRAYFALLRNYQHGNHEHIMTSLNQVKELERALKAIAGNEAGAKLFMTCYQTVLNEQEA